jgi:hypothetical protein
MTAPVSDAVRDALALTRGGRDEPDVGAIVAAQARATEEAAVALRPLNDDGGPFPVR